MKTQTITIIGLNRVGASVGLAIKQSPLDVTLIGYDPDDAKGQAALKTVQAIDKFETNLVNAARKADIVAITVSSADIESILRVIGAEVQSHTLVIDFSNLKRRGLDLANQYLQQGHYVGAVPVLAEAHLADGRSQTHNATPDLFKNSTFCLMPSPHADPQAVETAVKFGILLGTLPYFLDPDEYDSLVQGTETLPALVSLAMLNTVQQAAGWRDMLRFAGQPFALSTLSLENSRNIPLHALQNKQATLRWLDALMEELMAVRRLVDEEEEEILTALTEQMASERSKWLNAREENSWDERQSPPVERRSIAEHLFGGLVRRGDKKDA
ncbi:prephenate dehydrogenase [Candidatus Leptofilum sp.]|uniref:prephenate dehydrogenase n=1 Tax=Candidatus Leptofilum sp. TaxID=3241576 RepID=UPI003B5AD28B